MTDWLLPTEDDLLIGATGVIPRLKDRDFDAGSLFLNVPTNPVTGMIRYLRASDKFQEYNGTTWIDKLLSLAGGGTGAATANDARTNLGLGTIATQDASGVNITGGNLAGSGVGITNLNAANLASGTVPDARFPATLPVLSGANLTALNASNLASGTIAAARFPNPLPALDGSNLTNLNGSNVATGIVAPARLGTGSPSSANFLRGDGSWQVVPGVVSLQRGSITIPVGNLTGTYTCSPSVGSKASIVYRGHTFTNGTSTTGVRLSISGQTITATRIDTSGEVIVNFDVIDYQ